MPCLFNASAQQTEIIKTREASHTAGGQIFFFGCHAVRLNIGGRLFVQSAHASTVNITLKTLWQF